MIVRNSASPIDCFELDADDVVLLKNRDQRQNIQGAQKAVLNPNFNKEFLGTLMPEGQSLGIFFSDTSPRAGVPTRVFNVPDSRTALFNQKGSLSWSLSFDPVSAIANQQPAAK